MPTNRLHDGQNHRRPARGEYPGVGEGLPPMRSLEELDNLLAEYKTHKCSVDEREGGCPVCADIDQIEHEISLVRSGIAPSPRPGLAAERTEVHWLPKKDGRVGW